jgi:catechol 2,3-dioxygenase-like lactoylglutathione lyase family enzyme
MTYGVKIDFDHVAIAAHDATPVLERLVGRLGATDLYGAVDRGFRWVLLHAGDEGRGMLIELLEPWSAEEHPFLARFLERRGDGAHHLTFKTSDIAATIGAFGRAGFVLVDQRLENPTWREAFVRPRDAYGTIVQLVQTTIVRPPVADMLSAAGGPDRRVLDTFAGGIGSQVAEHWWTSPEPREHPVALSCVVFAADDPQAAAGFYESLLAGERVASTKPERIELAWPSGARVGFERAGGDGTGIVAFEFEAAAIEPFRIGQTAITFASARP